MTTDRSDTDLDADTDTDADADADSGPRRGPRPSTVGTGVGVGVGVGTAMPVPVPVAIGHDTWNPHPTRVADPAPSAGTLPGRSAGAMVDGVICILCVQCCTVGANIDANMRYSKWISASNFTFTGQRSTVNLYHERYGT